MKELLAHQLIQLAYRSRDQKFKFQLGQIKDVQEKKIHSYLKIFSQSSFGKKHNFSNLRSYQEFNENIPVTNYDNWKDDILKQRLNKDEFIVCQQIEKFQPTSGSTSKHKWIPYNKLLMTEFDQAIGPWLYDLYRRYPQVKKGTHYWSLSWMPDEMRDKENDDLSYFPWWKSWLLKTTMAVDSQIAFLPTSELAKIATLAYLCSQPRLSLIFIWSPTYLINLLHELSLKKDLIATILHGGDWTDVGLGKMNLRKIQSNKVVSKILENWDGVVNAQFTTSIWPNLNLISCWTTGSSSLWADYLQDLFPIVNIQGKGLFATEGVVTIPYENDYHLAYQSHFYEFMCLESQKIIPSWKLEIGQQVQPVISSGNGIFRYLLNDHLLVYKFNEKCPCLSFQGRICGVDLVGEKISNEIAQELLINLQEQSLGLISQISLVAISSKRPFYVGLFYCQKLNEVDLMKLQKIGENKLLENFHYKLARNLGQLEEFKLIVSDKTFDIYRKLMLNKGILEGDIKLENLISISEDEYSREVIFDS